jgi:hypothetical protein
MRLSARLGTAAGWRAVLPIAARLRRALAIAGSQHYFELIELIPLRLRPVSFRNG